MKFLIPAELAACLQATPSKVIPDGCILHEIAGENYCRIVIEPQPLPNSTEHLMPIIVSRMQKDHLDYFERTVTRIAHQFRMNRFQSMSPTNVYFSSNAAEFKNQQGDPNEDEEYDSDEDCFFTPKDMQITYI